MAADKKIAIQLQAEQPSEAESALQSLLSCDLVAAEQAGTTAYQFLLEWHDGALSLLATADKSPGRLQIDFTAQKLSGRLRDGLHKQGLGKAVGLKKNPSPTVLDATAGLGADAFLLASAGCKVSMLERSPVVYALLDDALLRARELLHSSNSSQVDAIANMQLTFADFLTTEIAPASVDVVYLDPMFPDRKSARSGKGMFLLQELLNEDCTQRGSAAAVRDEESSLLAKARLVARKRVVVKRAKHSPRLSDQEPDICFRGSSSRFDVYLCL